MGLAVDYHTAADWYIRKGLLSDTLAVVCMQ